MTTRIITFANQKGGVGKTTTAITVATILAALGKRILIVDFDPQGQCATHLGVEQDDCVFNLLATPKLSPSLWVRETGRDNLRLIPGNQRTATAQTILNAEGHPINSIDKALRLIKAEYDYILFDTAPSLGGLQERAIWASDGVIVPTAVDFLAAEGVGKFAQTMTELRAIRDWKGGLIGVLPTFFDDKTRESKQTMADLVEAFGASLILPPIHRATIMRECAAEGITIFEKDSKCRSSKEYEKLARIILKY